MNSFASPGTLTKREERGGNFCFCEGGFRDGDTVGVAGQIGEHGLWPRGWLVRAS
jgi:hypothetical protein